MTLLALFWADIERLSAAQIHAVDAQKNLKKRPNPARYVSPQANEHLWLLESSLPNKREPERKDQ